MSTERFHGQEDTLTPAPFPLPTPNDAKSPFPVPVELGRDRGLVLRNPSGGECSDLVIKGFEGGDEGS